MHVQDKQREAKCRHNITSSELFHDTQFTGRVDGAPGVDTKVEDADLNRHQELARAGPVLGFLRRESAT